MSGEEHGQKQDVVFFFGAGASVDAGIPDTYKFVTDFEMHIKEQHSSLIGTLKRIIDIRQRFNENTLGPERRQIDVEQLLDTLRRLIDRQREPLLNFYEKKIFCLGSRKGSFEELKTLLESYIRKTMIIEEELKIAYLRNLLQFETPIEVYTTNYDTCIEQLSYLNHRSYTDGFDVNWNKKNFDARFDIKHYKIHGSAIWYQNAKTKECMKVPVYPPAEGPLRSIYGEFVEPLLIYPAQKSEYIEPLTELQLMFKERIFSKETKFLVVVGYSFRDDYVIHMLWDAARVNEDLVAIIISPDSQQIFEERLKFVNKDAGDLSRISERIICLPYPFATIIRQLKNNYLRVLRQVRSQENQNLGQERDGQSPIPWQFLVRLCIDTEFSTKVEFLLEEKISKQWHELSDFGSPQDLTIYAIKGLLHSVIAHDGLEEKWLSRVNDSFEPISIENLKLKDVSIASFKLEFMDRGTAYSLGTVAEKWIVPILNERTNKINLLSKKYVNSLKSTEESFKRLEELRRYLEAFKGDVEWERYGQYKKGNPPDTRAIPVKSPVIASVELDNSGRLVLNWAKMELERIYGGKSFQFGLGN